MHMCAKNGYYIDSDEGYPIAIYLKVDPKIFLREIYKISRKSIQIAE